MNVTQYEHACIPHFKTYDHVSRIDLIYFLGGKCYLHAI